MGKKNDKEKSPRITRLDLNDETKKGVIAVLVFVFALIALLSVFELAGAFGKYFYNFGVLIFGQWGYFVLPLSLILVGIAILKSIHNNIIGTPFIGIGIFLISFLGLFQLI
jgi:hypothetical protein